MINQHPDFKDDPTAPIGVFDSGMGGLSVYLHLKTLMPNERFIYYADTANVPYGGKSGDEILLLTLQAVARLCKRGCKLIVIACNSASAHALKALRERCSVPIVGLVPAVKPACSLTKTRQIAVLATRATLNGYLLNDVINDVAKPQEVMVHKHFEPTLVPWVESGMPIDSQVANLLIRQTKQWADMGVDVIVLGCTHYPFFKGFLQTFIQQENLDVQLIDSGLAIAQRVKSLLDFFNIASPTPNTAPMQLYATRLDDDLLATAEKLSGEPFIELIHYDE
ncbi:glutamate racemase [Moraxella bovis]|uniref:Glutamate racemase n=1 Tax=Moraxella bovis TaxID=476 RepID=A0A378PT90_MORBO|nr:glutamate racemase [Moraxella bovis]STY91369.1 Glutamate racemase [Moraxella bovis]